jgi:hypothetical protein
MLCRYEYSTIFFYYYPATLCTAHCRNILHEDLDTKFYKCLQLNRSASVGPDPDKFDRIQTCLPLPDPEFSQLVPDPASTLIEDNNFLK